MAKTNTRQDEFKKAILNYVDDLYRFALSISHDTTVAEDLVSETVLKALENRNKLKDKTKLKQWMLRIVSNSFIDERRRAKRIQKVSIEKGSRQKSFSLFEMVTNSSFTEDGTPEKKLIQKLSNETIHQAIQGLPDVFRVAFVLCEVEELSYQEIAATLKIKVGTVRSRIARARSMLQQTLWEHAQETGIKMKQKPKKKEVECDC